ncbi:glycoside hydrolase family 88 protein [Neiella sp. HB171785]|uniref:Glycoside hydrolase family 88 protein n=2 Tax=Neiella litorisoli TaxID=2771431 RepID=A0A8J6R2L6_9GAMM|nr:glycoside hydrolase family 88 protein [Neiella litorisoli]
MKLNGKARFAIFSASAIAVAGLTACGNPQQADNAPASIDTVETKAVAVATIEVSNPSSFARSDEPIYISYHDLAVSSDTALQVTAGEQVIASQPVDYNLDGTVDGLLAMVDLAASEVVTLSIAEAGQQQPAPAARTQAEISVKTGGQWQPHSRYPDSEYQEYSGGEFNNVTELTPPSHYTDHSYWIRYEGPGIESDKVGYRIYLDWRNGFDIFGKLSDQPILQKVGQDGYESYHHLQDWGMDILKVGKSVGAGGFGLWTGDNIQLPSEVAQRTATIVANGPLFSGFTIDYDNWNSDAGELDVNAKFSMQAGSHLAKVDLTVAQPVEQLAIGVVKHKNTELITGDVDITGKAYTYIASWGKQALDGSPLGMVTLFRKEYLSEVVTYEHNYLAIVNPKGQPTEQAPKAKELHYYFGAVWQPESGIGDKQAFISYLEQQAERLTQPARLRITTAFSEAAKSAPMTAEQALSWSTKLANSELLRKGDIYKYSGWDVHRQRLPKFEYDIIGLYPESLNRLSHYTGDDAHKQLVEKITGSFIQDDGTIGRYKQSNFNIDNVAPGMALLTLYKQTGEQKYKLAADVLRQQLEHHPKTSEGAFWHKKKYTNQLWLDGVYMGMPFLASYSNQFEGGASFEEVVKEFKLTRKYLRDPKTGLYRHGWDEKKEQSWADPQTGLSPEFWARGVGWFAMAVVDVLAIIPESETELREPLLQISKELAQALVAYQDQATGTWWQVMDKAGQTGNYRESSASAMFVYFLATAVDQGYIDASYRDAALKGYQGLIDEFVLVHQDGTISMINQCYVAGLGFGRDGSYGYYMSEPIWRNDPKGNGPFILAGIAVHEMMSH